MKAVIRRWVDGDTKALDAFPARATLLHPCLAATTYACYSRRMAPSLRDDVWLAVVAMRRPAARRGNVTHPRCVAVRSHSFDSVRAPSTPPIKGAASG